MGFVDISSMNEESDLISNYVETVSLVNQFKNNLGEFSKFEETNNRYPVVIVIDELDRCRPNYAIQLLEVTKHFFSIDNVMFVLAINRRELEHSIRAIYGHQFNAQHYLNRFFDVGFNLPDADRREFIKNNMSPKTISVVHTHRNLYVANDLIYSVLTDPQISLRTVVHYVCRLNIVMASVGTNPGSEFVFTSVFALLARAVDSENYFLFNRGDITDADFSDSLFEKAGMRNLKKSPINATIDGMLCFVYLYKLNKKEEPTDISLSLIYQRIEHIRGIANSSDHEVNYANSVRNKIQTIERNISQHWKLNIGKIYFEAVKRIEMLVSHSPNGE